MPFLLILSEIIPTFAPHEYYSRGMRYENLILEFKLRACGNMLVASLDIRFCPPCGALMRPLYLIPRGL